jgi:hypothetical protein
LPSQESGPSHAPTALLTGTAAMHDVVAGWKPSAGQVLADPEQLSATSH